MVRPNLGIDSIKVKSNTTSGSSKSFEDAVALQPLRLKAKDAEFLQEGVGMVMRGILWEKQWEKHCTSKTIMRLTDASGKFVLELFFLFWKFSD